MKQESLDRLQEIQESQHKALAEQDLEALSELESEKTLLLQELTDFFLASDAQKAQLQSILKYQQDIERICTDVRDELGKQIKQVMERHKAISAYKDMN